MQEVSFNRIQDRLISEINKSASEILIAVAWFNNKNLFDSLLNKALADVKVKIIIVNDEVNNRIDGLNFQMLIDHKVEFYFAKTIRDIIEFKQIVGRGTRLFDGKEFFTIYDFVDAYKHFADPEWDGEPLEPEPPTPRPPVGSPSPPGEGGEPPAPAKQKIKIKLRDGKEREIQHMMSTSYWSADGRPISAQEFLDNLFGALPALFKDEDELRSIWSNPLTRRTLLEKLDEAGFGKEELAVVQKLINAEKSDLFDVLEYVYKSNFTPISRENRVVNAQSNIFALLNDNQKEFLEFVLAKYIETGVEELDEEKLPKLLELKYHSLNDGAQRLGGVKVIRDMFIGFQKWLYDNRTAV